MLVWKCVQVKLGQKCRKLARMIQGIAQPSTRIKRGHLTATHEKNTAISKVTHHQFMGISIHGNIFLTHEKNTAIRNRFAGAGEGVTRPCKCIFRVDSVPTPANNYF